MTVRIISILLTIVTVGCVSRSALPPDLSPNIAAYTPSSSSSVLRLSRDLTRLFASQSVGYPIWGVQIRSIDQSETLYRLNHNTLLIPASAIKLVTLAAAAEQLGWNFRFETLIITHGKIKDGVLQGDLVIRGSGDPTIGSTILGTANVFRSWAEALKGMGIQEITGRIIGDDGLNPSNKSAFDSLGFGWSWDDLAFAFAAPVGMLQFRENSVEITLKPGSKRDTPAVIDIDHKTSGLELINHVSTGSKGSQFELRIKRFPGQSAVELSGSIPVDYGLVRRRVSVDNPTRYFVTELRHALQSRGITVRGEAMDIDDLSDINPVVDGPTNRIVVRHMSPPLSEFAVDMMKRSQNLFSESLFQAIRPKESNEEEEVSSQFIVETLLASWSVPATQFQIVDGSGLSRYNHISAEALVRVLEHMASDPKSSKVFKATLPIAGQDGTLSGRMTGTLAEGNVQAKTGSMSNVLTLSGYVDTRDGERLVFAILANNFGDNANAINRIIDKAVVLLANFER